MGCRGTISGLSAPSMTGGILPLSGCYSSAFSPSGRWLVTDCSDGRSFLSDLATLPNPKIQAYAKWNRSGPYPQWGTRDVNDRGDALVQMKRSATESEPRLRRPDGTIETVRDWPKGKTGVMSAFAPGGGFFGHFGAGQEETPGLLSKGRLTELPFDRSTYSHAVVGAVAANGKKIGAAYRGLQSSIVVWDDQNRFTAISPIASAGTAHVAASQDGSVFYSEQADRGIVIWENDREAGLIPNPPLPRTEAPKPKVERSGGFDLQPFPPSVSLRLVGCSADGRVVAGNASYSSPTYAEAFIWTRASGMVPVEKALRELTWTPRTLRLNGINAAGNRLVGTAQRNGATVPVIVEIGQ